SRARHVRPRIILRWGQFATPDRQRESLRDDRRRCFDRRRGFALADVYGNVALKTRPGPHRSEIVIGLRLIEIARIKGEPVCRSQFSVIIISDVDTAARPAFVGSLYAWTRHARVGGPRATRPQTSYSRENKCCDERLCHNRSPIGAPSDATLLAKLGHNLQTCNRLAPFVSSPLHSGQLARLSASIAERRNLRWRTSGQAPV